MLQNAPDGNGTRRRSYRRNESSSMGAVPIENVYAQLCDLARARDFERLVLFGSRARGTNLPKSDIDLAVVGGDVEGFSEDVEERLWSLLTVDVVDLSRCTSDELRLEIARDGKVLYEAV